MLAHLQQSMQPWREGAELLAWHAASDNADYTVTASDAMLHIGHFSMSPRVLSIPLLCPPPSPPFSFAIFSLTHPCAAARPRAFIRRR